MDRFHRETKKKQFEIFAKTAQISLPWQQIQNLRTFCNFWHTELMAQKGLDYIKKQKRSNVCDRQTDRHTGMEINKLPCPFVDLIRVIILA